MSSEIGYYHFHRPSDIREFRSSIKNIIDYRLSERLAIIKDALLHLLLQVPYWDAEDKAAKVQRSSQMDDTSSLQSSFGLNEASDFDAGCAGEPGERKEREGEENRS